MFHLAQLFHERIVTHCQSLLRQAKEVQHFILHDPLGAPHNVAKKKHLLSSTFHKNVREFLQRSCYQWLRQPLQKKKPATKSLAQRAKDSRNLCHWVQEVSSTLLGSDSNHDKESPPTGSNLRGHTKLIEYHWITGSRHKFATNSGSLCIFQIKTLARQSASAI